MEILQKNAQELLAYYIYIFWIKHQAVLQEKTDAGIQFNANIKCITSKNPIKCQQIQSFTLFISM